MNKGVLPLSGVDTEAKRADLYRERTEAWDFGLGVPFSQGRYDFLVVGNPADPSGNSAERGVTGPPAEHGYNLRVQGYVQVENSMAVFSRYQPYIVIGRFGIDTRFPNYRPNGGGEEVTVGVVGISGEYFNTTQPGDSVVRAYGTGVGTNGRARRLHLGSNDGTVPGGYADASLIVDNTSIELRRPLSMAGSGITSAAAALPASPNGYLVVKIAGAIARIPYYVSTVSDTFTRADGALTGSTTESGGATWATTAINGSGPVPTATIVSNQAKLTCTGGGQCVSTVALSANVDASVTFSVLEDGMALMVRWVDGSNFVLFQKNAGAATYSLVRRASGTYATMGTTTGVTPASGDVIRVVASANTYTCYVNGTQVLNVTDAIANTTGASVGMQGSQNTGGNRFDDFSAVPV